MTALTDILTNILSPKILVENIVLIGQIISVMLLVIFDDFFTERLTFRSIDALKRFILQKSKEKFRKKYRFIIKYSFEFIATILFIAYFFAGYWVLSEYIVLPILIRLQDILLLLIIISFLVMSWMLNNKQARRKYLGYN